MIVCISQSRLSLLMLLVSSILILIFIYFCRRRLFTLIENLLDIKVLRLVSLILIRPLVFILFSSWIWFKMDHILFNVYIDVNIFSVFLFIINISNIVEIMRGLSVSITTFRWHWGFLQLLVTSYRAFWNLVFWSTVLTSGEIVLLGFLDIWCVPC